MTVVPVGEGSAQLQVAEVIVSRRTGRSPHPRDEPYGREGNRQEAEGDAAAHSCYGMGGCGWSGRRRGERGVADAGLLPRGHQAGEIVGVREEVEDLLDWVGKPLLG